MTPTGQVLENIFGNPTTGTFWVWSLVGFAVGYMLFANPKSAPGPGFGVKR
jgi:hypothetical protein